MLTLLCRNHPLTKGEYHLRADGFRCRFLDAPPPLISQTPEAARSSTADTTFHRAKVAKLNLVFCISFCSTTSFEAVELIFNPNVESVLTN